MLNVSSSCWTEYAFIYSIPRIINNRRSVTAIPSNPVITIKTHLPYGVRLILIKGYGAKIGTSWKQRTRVERIAKPTSPTSDTLCRKGLKEELLRLRANVIPTPPTFVRETRYMLRVLTLGALPTNTSSTSLANLKIEIKIKRPVTDKHGYGS